MSDIFEDADEALSKLKREKSIEMCSYEGCDITSEDMELEEYYGKPYCPTHLHLKKKETARKREKKKEKSVDANELITKLVPVIEGLIGDKLGKVEKVDEMMNKMDDILDKMSIRLRPSPRSILIHLLNDTEGHTIRDRMTNNFAGKDAKPEVEKHFQEMIKNKLLWKNIHGWHIWNPNLPKEKYEEITQMEISDDQWTKFLKRCVRRAREHLYNLGEKETIEREIFYEWNEERRGEIIDRWKMRTGGRGRKPSNAFFFAPIKEEVLESLNEEEFDVESPETFLDDIRKFDAEMKVMDSLNRLTYFFRKSLKNNQN